MYTILITGGHHNSALVVARDLLGLGHKVIWVGHRYSSRGDQEDSAEYREVTSSHIPFHDLRAGRLILHPIELLRLPLGFFQALGIIRTTRPTAILSFGGYLGGTMALAARFSGIPVYLHEQTVTAGRANKLIGRLSRKIYLTWAASARYFPASKLKVVGLPLRAGILSPKAHALFTRRKPTLLVMGGKQGAHRLNQFIFTHLSTLLTHFNIVHQTGTSSVIKDLSQAKTYLAQLGSLSDCYLPLGYILEDEIGMYLKSADYYLGRSGAHICYELGLLGIPSILVPLMHTHDFEQHKNAEVLVRAKLSVILPQTKLTLPNFFATYKDLQALTPGRPMALPRNASKILLSDLLSTLD